MTATFGVDRQTPYFTPTPAGLRPRPWAGTTLHSTQTATAVLPHSQGSWWLMIGRSEGELYDDVPRDEIAWHVRAADRWRPSWLLPSQVAASDVNWSCEGIELVSSAEHQAGPEPYTDWQYRCLREIVCPWIYVQRGPEHPYVGHGEVQADRTDPVAFDWARAGFTPFIPGVGHLWRPAPPTPAAVEQRIMHLDDDQIKESVLPALWAVEGLPYGPFFGVASAWVSEYRQGRYRGRPLSPEVDVPGTDVAWQRFEFGLVTYRRSDATFSWSG